jgi:iron(III) transport system permease protein
MPLGLVISGSMAILVFAYLVRFLSISLNTMDSGLSAIKPGIDESARSLGASKKNVLTKVHLPILKTSVLTAFLLVFVEVMKELPTTLILRPFNFNTLAVKTYELASDERLFDAALPAISIVVISLLPILLITKSIISEKTQHV